MVHATWPYHNITISACRSLFGYTSLLIVFFSGCCLMYIYDVEQYDAQLQHGTDIYQISTNFSVNYFPELSNNSHFNTATIVTISSHYNKPPQQVQWKLWEILIPCTKWTKFPVWQTSKNKPIHLFTSTRNQAHYHIYDHICIVSCTCFSIIRHGKATWWCTYA